MVKDPGTFETYTNISNGESTLEYNGKSYYIVDTRGFCDSERYKNVLIEVARGIELTFGDDGQPGVDTVILVISALR